MESTVAAFHIGERSMRQDSTRLFELTDQLLIAGAVVIERLSAPSEPPWR